MPTLSMSVKSSRICDSSFRLVDKNPIVLNEGFESLFESDSPPSFKLSNCCSLIYENNDGMKRRLPIIAVFAC